MKPTTTSRCPYHADMNGVPPSPADHACGNWPPGPLSGLTGWGLLRQMANDPLGMFAKWQKQYGDIIHIRIWPEHQIILTDPELVRELLVSQHDATIRWERGIQVFSKLHGHSVLTSEGEPWKAKRQALQPAFSPKSVQSFVPAIASAAERAFSQWRSDDQDWPIESALTSLAMDVILRMMFSSEADMDARMAERAVHDTAVAGSAEMYWPASWPDWVPWKRTIRQAVRLLNDLIHRHIQARLALERAAWPKDLLSRLLTFHQEDPATWPLQAVRDECMTAFLAGHETAAATLTWWVWCMASNPQAQTTARREVLTVLKDRAPTAEDIPSLVYLTQTLQETLRLYPAAPMLLTRRAVRPIRLGPWQLPARTMFTIPVQLMHHDPRWFPKPDVYAPERFAANAPGGDTPSIPRGAYMPFGTGPRVCLGQHLAMAEMTVITAMLLQRFTLSIPEGMTAPEPEFNISLRPRQPLRLKLTSRLA